MLGTHFESEIREQPRLWRKLAGSDAPARLAAALATDEVCFIASGSSLFAGQLGALALMRSGVRAWALPASEAAFAIEGIRDATVVAISQSGRSGDLLVALDAIAPRRIVAITNDLAAPLASRVDEVVDLDVGVEEAIPATKSVSTTMALLLLAVAHRTGTSASAAEALKAAADTIALWLGSEQADLVEPARRIADRRGVAILGTGYGVPVAQELALKLKEASYLHAEAFAAGEFRHGSMAMLDEGYSVLTFADGALRIATGANLEGAAQLGPTVAGPFSLLGSLVAGQMLALHAGRIRLVDSDAPRGLTKYVL